MKHILICALISLTSICLQAQDRKSISLPFKNGQLTFQYYENAEGIKVPDGRMKFVDEAEKYTEEGECKDGFMEGPWTATFGNQRTIVFNYAKGMLEGKTEVSEFKFDKKTKKKTLESKAVYNFHDGHLVGENVFEYAVDRLECNHDSLGNRIGTWKLNDTYYKWSDTEPDKLEQQYKISVLGEKEISKYPDELHLTIPFTFFNEKVIRFNYSQMAPLRHKKRPVLPTFQKIDFGARNQTHTIEYDKQDRAGKIARW